MDSLLRNSIYGSGCISAKFPKLTFVLLTFHRVAISSTPLLR